MKAERERVLIEGVVIGLVGYAMMATVFGLLNVLAGRSFFHTAALLGQGLVSDQGDVVAVAAAPVLAYNAVHALVFLAIGIAVAFLIYELERHPDAWVLIMLVAVSGFMFVELMFLLVAAPATAMLPWWSVLLASVGAGLVMGAVAYVRHPTLWRRVRSQPEATT